MNFLYDIKMTIRKAKIEDSKLIAAQLFLAMEEILYSFIGTKSEVKAIAFLNYFIERENNQYSYSNCFVAEIDTEIVGAICMYDGADLEFLRQPIIDYVKSNYNMHFTPENETQTGEMYIDSIGINNEFRGKGIGTKLLQFIIEKCSITNTVIGLLVDIDNPNAEKLYINLGFEWVGNKTLAGKNLKHLQLKPKLTF